MPVKARGRHPLTLLELREQLDYNPQTGILKWKVAKPRIFVGRRAGNKGFSGGRDVTVCGFTFIEHRLIWWLMTGRDPGKYYVDHRNRKRGDNRWSNLRLATHGQNYVNSKQFGENRGIVKRNKSYRIRIGYEGKRFSLEAKTIKQARAIRRKLELELYGEFACCR